MSRPRKIVLIGSVHPLRGGLATFNERLIRDYRHQGEFDSIYTFSQPPVSFHFVSLEDPVVS